jgi:hypothetical protein
VVVDDERPAGARDPLVGKNHWLVFANTGTAFSATPKAWTLPFPLIPTSGAPFNALATTAHLLADLSGAGRADFLVHRDTERASPDPLVGKNHWLRFPNTGAAFSSTPAPWTLPFPLIGGGKDQSDFANANHAVLGLRGVAEPDLLVIRDVERPTSDPLVGKSHWLLFTNTGAGFNPTPKPAALPYPLLPPAGGDFNQLATERHVLLDLEGDGFVDFIELEPGERAQVDPLLGKSHWLVYANRCQ